MLVWAKLTNHAIPTDRERHLTSDIVREIWRNYHEPTKNICRYIIRVFLLWFRSNCSILELIKHVNPMEDLVHKNGEECVRFWWLTSFCQNFTSKLSTCFENIDFSRKSSLRLHNKIPSSSNVSRMAVILNAISLKIIIIELDKNEVYLKFKLVQTT